jgi:signal recognition particle GTPase
VRYVGTGETADDFSLFDPEVFADGLFTMDAEADPEG